MSFKYKDLLTSLDAFKQEKDGSWVVVIGCAPASVDCPNTQPTKLVRKEPADFDLIPGKARDFLYLKRALRKKLEQLSTFEKSLLPEERQLLESAEKKLGSEEIEEVGSLQIRNRQ